MALFRCSRPAASAPPPPGSSLLLVDGLEVRLQNDDVTAVPVTSRRRRQLLRQAKSSDEKRFECKVSALSALSRVVVMKTSCELYRVCRNCVPCYLYW